MKQMLSAVLFACLMLCAGCAYFKCRTRDFGDMFTLAVEDKSFGCDVRVIIPVGISLGEGKGYGLREGYAGSYDFKESVFFFCNFVYYDVDFSPANDDRKKGYWLDMNLFKDGSDGTYKVWREGLNVQARIGVYGGLRAGVNVPEVLDFVLGWSTLDIMGDDKDAAPRTAGMAK